MHLLAITRFTDFLVLEVDMDSQGHTSHLDMPTSSKKSAEAPVSASSQTMDQPVEDVDAPVESTTAAVDTQADITADPDSQTPTDAATANPAPETAPGPTENK